MWLQKLKQITELLSLFLESKGESTAEILGGVLGTLTIILSVTVIITVTVLIMLRNHGRNQKWV